MSSIILVFSEATSSSSSPPVKTGTGLIDSRKVYGFDIEWRPNFVAGAPQNKAAVVQLCHQEDCHIFHISRAGNLPASLAAFLKNPNTVKVGVNISHDVHKLKRDFDLEVNGFLDLVGFAKAKYQEEVPASLSGLAFRVLMKDLPKPRAVVMSDWERVLTPAQLLYAANDAAAGYQIFCAVESFLPRRPTAKQPAPAGTFVRVFSSLARWNEESASPFTELVNEAGVKLRKIRSGVALTYLRVMEGRTVAEIAQERKVELIAVENEIVQAVRLGLKLDLAQFGVSAEMSGVVMDLLDQLNGMSSVISKISKRLQMDPTSFRFQLAISQGVWRKVMMPLLLQKEAAAATLSQEAAKKE